MGSTLKYGKEVEAEEENRKKGKLKMKHEKYKKMFVHFRDEKLSDEEVMKLELWKQASKDDISNLLSKDQKLKVTDEKKGMFRFMKEFVLYPVTYQTMLRISLTSKYVFQVLEDYSIALYFRKFYLRNIFDNMKSKDLSLERYRYSYYKNIVA